MQTYFAKSLFVSKTFWANVALIIVAIVKETTLGSSLPAVITENLLSLAAVINIVLRYFTVRPVAIIPPSEIKPVEVPSI